MFFLKVVLPLFVAIAYASQQDYAAMDSDQPDIQGPILELSDRFAFSPESLVVNRTGDPYGNALDQPAKLRVVNQAFQYGCLYMTESQHYAFRRNNPNAAAFVFRQMARAGMFMPLEIRALDLIVPRVGDIVILAVYEPGRTNFQQLNEERFNNQAQELGLEAYVKNPLKAFLTQTNVAYATIKVVVSGA